MTVKGIRLRLKWALLSAVDLLGFPLKLEGREGEVQILCFHGVCADTDEFINGRFHKESEFRDLLTELKQRFHIISLDDFLANRLNPDKLNILLTFDDGYRNNLTLVLPIIEESGCPITIFVTGRTDLPLWTDLVDLAAAYPSESGTILNELLVISGLKTSKELKAWLPLQPTEVVLEVNRKLNELPELFLDNTRVFWELLSDNDLRLLQTRPLVSLANHGANHLSFVTLTEDQMAQEINEVQTRLNNIGSAYSSVFAYPYGHHDEVTIARLNELGIEQQFLSEWEEKEAPYLWKRLTLNPFISTRNMLRIIYKGEF
ncbi:MAG: polysaccharide deacetylase family protein [Flavobacteriia bacterium]|nr:polysaccharide deacetylase family protein [Flavobacteriia bacterium]